MTGRKMHLYVICILIYFGGVSSLRDVLLEVQPTPVIRGGTAALICLRDMQGAPLYSVKWYRGTHEFYRYTPLETPNTRVFGLPGIYVDMNSSNGSQVLLKKMDFSQAGNYSCEVTAESHFSTQIATKFVDVLALPSVPPFLVADKERYSPGETLRANCSAAPSRPAANLTVFVNNEPVRSSETSLHPFESGLQWTSVNAEVPVSSDLFPGGRLRVACQAAVYNVYNFTTKLDFFTPDVDPRPERITLTGGSSASRFFQNWLLLLFLLFLPIAMGQEFSMFYSEHYDDPASDYYDEESHNKIIMSLVGA